MSLAQVVAITADGAGGMPGFSSQLSSAEIDAVAAYVLTLGGGGGPPPPTTTTTLPPGTPQGSGAALYRQNCAGCHGANADGGPGGPLVGTSLSFAQQVSVTAHGRGTMPGFSPQLTSSEIDSIIRYVQGLGGPGATTTTTVPPDEESGSSIYGRLCAACHGGDGSGGPGGPITGTAFHGSALSTVITDGLATMPGFGTQLNGGQVARLVDYVERLAAGEVAGVDVGDGSDLDTLFPGADQIDPAAGFTGHASELEGSPTGDAVALGSSLESSSPLPVGNSLGWSLALGIAAALIAVGSVVTGAMPREAEERAAG
jgi:mono/diheme cytochrome c family protein